jgi:hypothetical protein
VLMVFCDMLGCTPSDLIRPIEATASAPRPKKAAAARGGGGELPRPKRARVKR